MFFCKEAPGLYEYERLMQQPPGYMPRQSGVIRTENNEAVIEEIYNNDKLEEILIRLTAYKVPKRFADGISELQKKSIYKDSKHRKRFKEILNSSIGRQMMKDRRFLASVFLLSADENLWKQVKGNVTDSSINYEEIKIEGITLDQYIFLQAAKDIYLDRHLVSVEDLEDKELVSDAAFRLVLAAYAVKFGGIEMIKKQEERNNG